MRGIAIAEGDILGLSIRELRPPLLAPARMLTAVSSRTGLVNEILIGRYEMPQPADPNSLLARHEASLIAELREVVRNVSHHRSSEVNRLVLPYCQPTMEAIGHRMAYDAAVAAGVRPCLIDLYVANVVKLDPAWYAEHTGLSRAAQLAAEEAAHDAVFPLLGELVREMDVFAYVHAPIVSDGAWDAFVGGLKVFRGSAYVDAFDADARRRADIDVEDAKLVRSHL